MQTASKLILIGLNYFDNDLKIIFLGPYKMLEARFLYDLRFAKEKMWIHVPSQTRRPRTMNRIIRTLRS